MKAHYIAWLFVGCLLLYGCGTENRDEQLPAYENTYYWISSPVKPEKPVDVFYVYPTIFGGTGEMSMNLSDELLRAKASKVAGEQGGVYTESCNLFAPYYRQMALDVLAMSDDTLNKYIAIGYADVKKAFIYYLENLNDGRPFILAGHSQGTMILIELMKELFGKPELMQKLVAAYLIGYSVTPDDLGRCPWMKIAENANDIGVIITYNTQSQDAVGSPVLLPGAQCVNPLNWTISQDVASREMNLGAVFFSDAGAVDSIVPHFTDAWVDGQGALVAGIPDPDLYSGGTFPRGVFHKYDYNFFYNNLKQNVENRVHAFLNKTTP